MYPKYGWINILPISFDLPDPLSKKPATHITTVHGVNGIADKLTGCSKVTS